MKTVLLIDGDQDLRATLRGWLSADGWNVLEADNGEIGWELLLQHKPAVVICDLLMPRCNGFRFCRRIHQDPNLKATKIIVSSGRAYSGDRLGARQAGADEYLVKPVKRHELATILDRLLRPEASTFMRLWERLKTPSNNDPSKAPAAGADAGSPPSPTGPLLPPGHPTTVKFWGVRGSIATPGPSTLYYGGNTSCVEVRADGEIIILDAGSGIRPLGHSLVQEFKNRPLKLTLLISHTHWDHIQGYPFFAPAYDANNSLHIRGFEGSSESLAEILSSQMKANYFPISMQQMPGSAVVEELQDMEFNVGKVKVTAAFMNHPGICVGYRLTTSCGSIAFLPDNEPYQRLRGSDHTVTVSPESLAYARRQDEKLIDFIRGVDVLIIDSQYDDSEYQAHVGWGHGCLDDVVTLALVAEAKQLFLFHHDPDHDDAQITRMVNWARDLVALHGESLVVDAAREGVEVVLSRESAATVSQPLQASV
ncbi:MAG: response regulator [Candidatus Zixiibacteriota bacterium]